MGKVGKIIFYSIVVVLVLFFFLTVLFNDEYKGSSLGLNIGMALAVACGIAALVSSVLFLINNPTSAKRMLISIGVLALIAIISYVVAPGTLGLGYEKYGVETVEMSKRIDMGLYVAGALTFLAVASIVVSEAISMIKH